jgi:AraC family transcriptional regulator, carnitine catabolism transcriptional activator
LTFFAANLIDQAMPRDIAFLLVPRFSMIALFSALEPLRVANRFRPETFSWRFVSLDSGSATASNGIPVTAGGGLDTFGAPDMAVICASYGHEAGMSRPVLNELRRLARGGALLAAVDTGAFLLAEAGLLDGYRATCHWETLPAFRETYDQIDVADATYVLDRGRMTASGGAAPLDMMLDWLAAIEGEALSRQVADTLVRARQDHPGEARVPAGTRYGVRDARVVEAIRLMEGALEDKMCLEAIAAQAGVSHRQLDRLFQAELGAAPVAFYRQLRLERARRLLAYSAMSVRDVSLATGFGTLAEFSRAFKARFGKPPSKMRTLERPR